MAPNIAAATVSLPKAAYAADLTPETLRQWIARGHFEPQGDVDREGKAWRKFAPVDVLRLAVMVRIARYGFTISEAAEIVREHVDPLTFGMVDVSRVGRPGVHVAVPLSMLVSRLNGATLLLSRQKGGTLVEASPPMTTHGEHDHAVLIRVGRIAQGAAERLADLERMNVPD